jgi:hypothetical protein
MDTARLKVKVGEHEFESEGPAEVVQRQYEAWQKLIATAPRQKDVTPATTTTQAKIEEGTVLAGELEKILRAEGRVISMTALPPTPEESALLLMLGQKTLRANESVTGSELMDGLSISGVRVLRVDRVMDKLATDGFVIRTGANRATRYRLTNQGLAKSQEIAKTLLQVVA